MLDSIPEPGPFNINPEIPVKYRPLFLKCLNGLASPRQAIKMQCLTCVRFESKDVAGCPAERCPLHRYRPYQKEAPKAGKTRKPPRKVAEGPGSDAGG